MFNTKLSVDSLSILNYQFLMQEIERPGHKYNIAKAQYEMSKSQKGQC